MSQISAQQVSCAVRVFAAASDEFTSAAIERGLKKTDRFRWAFLQNKVDSVKIGEFRTSGKCLDSRGQAVRRPSPICCISSERRSGCATPEKKTGHRRHWSSKVPAENRGRNRAFPTPAKSSKKAEPMASRWPARPFCVFRRGSDPAMRNAGFQIVPFASACNSRGSRPSKSACSR